MMDIFWIATILLFLAYSIEIIGAGYGLKKYRSPVLEDSFQPISDKILVSVIIALRNEESNILQLIEQLKNQNFPDSEFEVIFINDHSTDNTLKILQENCNATKFRYLNLIDGSKGKKAALEFGIGEANGDLILSTDADCQLSPNWINAFYTSFISNHHPKLILGIVDMQHISGFFQEFQRFNLLSMVFTGIGKAVFNKPVLNNGANLAYQKGLFSDKSIMQNKHASGDDIFLLHYVKKHFKRKIKICIEKDSVVYTKPQKSVGEFIQQHIRWGSKAKHYKDFDTIWLTLVVFGFNLAIVCAFVIAFLTQNFYFVLGLYLGKSLVDVLFFARANKYLDKPVMIEKIFIYQLFYPLYISMLGIAANVIPYRWKGRNKLR